MACPETARPARVGAWAYCQESTQGAISPSTRDPPSLVSLPVKAGSRSSFWPLGPVVKIVQIFPTLLNRS